METQILLRKFYNKKNVKEVFIQLKETEHRRRSQDIPSRLRRQISLETNAIQIQTNSPSAEGAVYQEICPSLSGRVKFVFLFPLLAGLRYSVCANKTNPIMLQNMSAAPIAQSVRTLWNMFPTQIALKRKTETHHNILIIVTRVFITVKFFFFLERVPSNIDFLFYQGKLK